MGITLGSNFDVQTGLPLDSRQVVADLTARDAIVSGRRYIGLEVFVTATLKKYVLTTGITNSDWVESGGGGGGALVVSSQLSLTSAAPIQITGTEPRRKINIQSSAGEQDLGTLANQIQNGTTNGDELKLEGQSSTNYIILRKGIGNVLINGDWYALDGSTITLIWNSTRSQWVEDTRNML